VALLPQSGGVISNLRSPGDGTVSGPAAGDTAGTRGDKIDVIFPILHGPFGEDGTVQGLLKLADIPFVGAGVLGSAVGMDKDVMKRLLRDGGIPMGKFMVLRSHETPPVFGRIVEELGLPFFVKPANMGSSVGVSKIHHEGEYLEGVKTAFTYDRKIILEEYIRGRELECSVLGNEEPVASAPGEIIASHEFYSYDAKYLDERGARLEIPARVPEAIAGKIRELAVKTFKTLECEGLARVDFFLEGGCCGRLLVNEINTMPGFTKISMYPKLWEASGIAYRDLIDRLLEFAILRYKKEGKLKTSY
jgi:D-alanine-D-alanine ligase